MAQLIFPPSPGNGQEFVGDNGVTYTYQSNPGVWTAAGGGAGGSVIPSGTVMSFFQAAAPTGWVQNTSHNNKAIRVVNTAGGGSGGTIPFTTFFSATSNYTGVVNITSGSVGATTLTVAQLASHDHSYQFCPSSNKRGPDDNSPSNPQGATTGAAGSNQSHTHSLVGVAADGNFTSNFAVQYIDMILATKS